MLKLEYQDQICRIGVIGPIYASAWTAMPSADHVARIRDGFQRRLDGPDPVAVLIIGLDADRPLSTSDAIRNDITSVFKLGKDRPGPTAAVVEAKGFIAAFVRSLFAGIFLVTRGRRKNRVFARRDQALLWLQEELGAATPADLAAAVTDLTRDLR